MIVKEDLTALEDIEIYHDYAVVTDSDIVELTIDDETHYGFIFLGRWDTVPEKIHNDESFHHYELRDDGHGDVCSIANSVTVNFSGTFITFDEFPLDEEKEVDVNYI